MKNEDLIPAIVFILLIFAFYSRAEAFEGRPILDEFGNKTGHVTIYPNPNGDPLKHQTLVQGCTTTQLQQ